MTMTPHDDSSWDDLSEALGLEAKPKPKLAPIDEASAPTVAPTAIDPQQTPGEPPQFPTPAWSDDSTNESKNPASDEWLVNFPDANLPEDESDTLLEPSLANEEFASDDESAEGESEGDGGKKRRRRRRKRRGGQPGEGEGPLTETPQQQQQAEPRSMAEAIQNLVANWNVPSWNEIVGSLYRPGGDRERDRG